MALTKVNIPGLHGGISQQSPHLRLQNQHSDVVNVECTLLDGLRFPRNTTVPQRWGVTEGALDTVTTTDGREWLLSYLGNMLYLTPIGTDDYGAIGTCSTAALSYFTGVQAKNLKVLNLLDTVFILNTTKVVDLTYNPYSIKALEPFAMFRITEVFPSTALQVVLRVNPSVTGVIGNQVVIGGVTPATSDTIFSVASQLGAALRGLYTRTEVLKETGVVYLGSATVKTGGRFYEAKQTHVSSAGNAPVVGGNAYWLDQGTYAVAGAVPDWASGATYLTKDDLMDLRPDVSWDQDSIATQHPIDLFGTRRIADQFGIQQLYVTLASAYEKLPPEPPQFMNGVVISPSDGYYVTWDSATRKYKETVAPNREVTMRANTMPYKLEYNSTTGSWTLSEGDWKNHPRLVGDDDSAPLPDIYNRRISHMFYHRNRLCFLADNFVVMSRANEPYKLFPQTATEVLDDDPISVNPNSTGYHPLLHAVPSNKQLYLFAAAKQYVLHSGYDALTPKTIAIDETTSYRMVPDSVPLQLEDSIVLLLDKGVHVGVLEYKITDAEYLTEGVDLTDQCPRLIPKGYNSLAYASASKSLFVWKRNTADTECFSLRMHRSSEGALVQLAWQRHIMPMAIRLLKARSSDELWVAYDTIDPAAPSTISRLPMDVEQVLIRHSASLSTIAGQRLAIDITQVALQVSNTVYGAYPTLNHPGSRFVAVDLLSGVPLDDSTEVPGVGRWFTNPMYTGSQRPVAFGYTLSPAEVELSPLVLRDDNGLPDNNLEATIARLQINWTGGEFSVVMSGEAMPQRTVDVMPRSFVPGSHTPGGSYLEVEPTKVTVLYPAGRCKIKLRHKGTIPTRINNISYELDVHKG